MPHPDVVLVLGHRFASLDVERSTLAGVAEVVDGTKLDPDERRRALARARAVLLGTRDRLDAASIEAMERCRAIVRYGAGMDNIDVPTATRRGIVVSNVADYAVEDVSDHAVALLLAAARHLVPALATARTRQWTTTSMAGVRRLCTQTVGLVGFGRIGQATARKVRPLVRRVLAFDPVVPAQVVREQSVEPAALEELLAASDYVSLHCPVTPRTRHLVRAETLSLMRPGAWLVNTSRGELVDEPALAAALVEGRLGGAALDVLSQEPPPEGHPLLGAPNVLLTPHVAYYSTESMRDLQRLAVEEVRRVLQGERPRSAVNDVSP